MCIRDSPSVQAKVYSSGRCLDMDGLVELAHAFMELSVVLGTHPCGEVDLLALLPSAFCIAAYRVDLGPVEDLRDELFFEGEYHA